MTELHVVLFGVAISRLVMILLVLVVQVQVLHGLADAHCTPSRKAGHDIEALLEINLARL